MPDEPTGYRDAWGQWHEANPPDLGYAGVHVPGSIRGPLPPTAEHDAVAEAERIIAPADTIPDPEDPSRAVLGPHSANLGPVPAGKNASDGYWAGGVWQERPPKPKLDAIAAIRNYVRFMRETFDRDDER